MKTRYILYRRDNGVFYTEDTASGKQSSLRTRDETEAKSLLNAKNEAQRQPVLNLHLARAYLTASDPAFVERTWQIVMEQMQSRGKDSNQSASSGISRSEQRRYFVEPSRFTTLKRGGVHHGFQVEAIVYNGGHRFPTGALGREELLPYKLITFNQR
jgi:hypothetical protein